MNVGEVISVQKIKWLSPEDGVKLCTDGSYPHSGDVPLKHQVADKIWSAKLTITEVIDVPKNFFKSDSVAVKKVFATDENGKQYVADYILQQVQYSIEGVSFHPVDEEYPEVTEKCNTFGWNSKPLLYSGFRK